MSEGLARKHRMPPWAQLSERSKSSLRRLSLRSALSVYNTVSLGGSAVQSHPIAAAAVVLCVNKICSHNAHSAGCLRVSLIECLGRLLLTCTTTNPLPLSAHCNINKLVVEINQHWISPSTKALWPCIKVSKGHGHENEHILCQA